MKSVPEVNVGEIWRDWDTRYRNGNVGRTLRVTQVDDVHVTVEQLTEVSGAPVKSPAKPKRLKRDRFRPTTRGYKLVQPAPSVNVEIAVDDQASGAIREAINAVEQLGVALARPPKSMKLHRAEQELARLEGALAKRRVKIQAGGSSSFVAREQSRLRNAIINRNKAQTRLDSLQQEEARRWEATHA